MPDNAGMPWFVAADVCRCLEIGTEQTRRLDEDEKGLRTVQTPGGPQQMATVNEPGVYRLVFTSRKPSAERFKRWLAHDVLPTIRRTGGYPAAAPAADLPADLRVQVEMVREARLTFGRSAARPSASAPLILPGFGAAARARAGRHGHPPQFTTRCPGRGVQKSSERFGSHWALHRNVTGEGPGSGSGGARKADASGEGAGQ
ncbi:Bro-N domain-containing protein [Magnetospirillum sp. UT-4]|uniref:BRO-N domain-containing protein n=1 Tax=Magnetospirillum sp. UT-4 TaxID=2681467 RepID=UPI001C2D7D3D|nr:Bro-N domain-containing protein [Magnetospirillum sp. UT-4]